MIGTPYGLIVKQTWDHCTCKCKQLRHQCWNVHDRGEQEGNLARYLNDTQMNVINYNFVDDYWDTVQYFVTNVATASGYGWSRPLNVYMSVSHYQTSGVGTSWQTRFHIRIKPSQYWQFCFAIVSTSITYVGQSGITHEISGKMQQTRFLIYGDHTWYCLFCLLLFGEMTPKHNMENQWKTCQIGEFPDIILTNTNDMITDLHDRLSYCTARFKQSSYHLWGALAWLSFRYLFTKPLEGRDQQTIQCTVFYEYDDWVVYPYM